MKKSRENRMNEENDWKYPIKLAGQIWGGQKYFCVFCNKDILGFKDRLSAKEFRINGLCQGCQDKTFR